MKHLLITLLFFSAPIQAINFIDYDMHHGFPSYVMVDGFGNEKKEITIDFGKSYEWMVAPDHKDGQWYRFQERFIGAESDCGVDEVQTGHRYASDSIWEVAGQPNLECGDGTLNIYANLDRKPILIAPSHAYDGRSILSDLWTASTPFHARATGYPHQNPVAKKLSYSYAEVVDHYATLFVDIPGYGEHEYHDVVKVFWRHGSASSIIAPCGDDTPGQFLIDGYRVYGNFIYYARNIGIIKEKLLWYCDFTGRMHGTYAPNVDGNHYVYYRMP